MNLQQQKELIKLYNQYQGTAKETIKTNLKSYMKEHNIKPVDITEQTGIPIQTIYQLRKTSNVYKPDLITSIIICDMLGISITKIMEPIIILESKGYGVVKWTTDLKKEFISDYSTITIDELCKKYEITPRTAQEYNKNFLRDIERYNKNTVQTYNSNNSNLPREP